MQQMLHFNSRTHVECDGTISPWATNYSNFNSRTHVECDKRLHQPMAADQHFNSRTHVECDLCAKDVPENTKNFNSRTHVECDKMHRLYRNRNKISTHALTWSATQDFAALQKSVEFQLTHSRGVRRSTKNSANWHGRISTHALTWSATYPEDLPEDWRKFQLTHSRGVRHAVDLYHSNGLHFNSRTHVECDSKYCIKKRFTTQYMGIYCFLSSIILIFFIYSKK